MHYMLHLSEATILEIKTKYDFILVICISVETEHLQQTLK